jgi:hypothetical protein
VIDLPVVRIVINKRAGGRGLVSGKYGWLLYKPDFLKNVEAIATAQPEVHYFTKGEKHGSKIDD